MDFLCSNGGDNNSFRHIGAKKTKENYKIICLYECVSVQMSVSMNVCQYKHLTVRRYVCPNVCLTLF